MAAVEGIDVSKWQTATPSLAGLSFLFARASIGTLPDPTFAMHTGNARRAGLVTGAYHFGDSRLPPVRQARTFLEAAGDVDFYFLDVEGSHAMSADQIRAFFDEVHAAGKRIGLYHSLSGFPELGQDFNWVAFWSGSPPSRNWTFWQYRGSPLDRDRFIGSEAELRALASTLPDTATEDTVTTITVTKYETPRAVSGANVTLYLPDGSSRSVASLESLAVGDATIEQSDGKAPHGSGWVKLGKKPWAGWFVAAAAVTVAAAPPPPPTNAEAVRAVLDELAPVIAAAIAQRRP